MTPEEFSADLGRLVRTARRDQGLDQETLATVAQVSTRTVYRLEQGHPALRLDSVVKILSALGIRLEPSSQ